MNKFNNQFKKTFLIIPILLGTFFLQLGLLTACLCGTVRKGSQVHTYLNNTTTSVLKKADIPVYNQILSYVNHRFLWGGEKDNILIQEMAKSYTGIDETLRNEFATDYKGTKSDNNSYCRIDILSDSLTEQKKYESDGSVDTKHTHFIPAEFKITDSTDDPFKIDNLKLRFYFKVNSENEKNSKWIYDVTIHNLKVGFDKKQIGDEADDKVNFEYSFDPNKQQDNSNVVRMEIIPSSLKKNTTLCIPTIV